MDKRYYACVHGEWASDWGRRRAVKEPLHKYLTADGERRVRVQADGLASHTVFNLIDRWPEYALLEAELKTGRTHQIRVHLQHLELPIVIFHERLELRKTELSYLLEWLPLVLRRVSCL